MGTRGRGEPAGNGRQEKVWQGKGVAGKGWQRKAGEGCGGKGWQAKYGAARGRGERRCYGERRGVGVAGGEMGVPEGGRGGGGVAYVGGSWKRQWGAGSCELWGRCWGAELLGGFLVGVETCNTNRF